MFALGFEPEEVIWVPTQGGTKGHLDVAAGNSDFSTASLVEARALIEGGKLRPLATMAAERISLFPDTPTLKEQGIDYSYGLWHGVTGPKDLDPEALKVLSPAPSRPRPTARPSSARSKSAGSSMSGGPAQSSTPSWPRIWARCRPSSTGLAATAETTPARGRMTHATP